MKRLMVTRKEFERWFIGRKPGSVLLINEVQVKQIKNTILAMLPFVEKVSKGKFFVTPKEVKQAKSFLREVGK